MKQVLPILPLVLVLGACASPSVKSVRLPCEMACGLCYLESRVNGSTDLSMVLDSGSSFTILDSKRAAELKLQSSGSGEAAGAATGGDRGYNLIRDVDIQAGSIRLTKQTIVAMPFQYVRERVGRPTDGTLGSNIFYRFVVELSYSQKNVTLSEPQSWSAVGHGEEIPIQLEGNIPYVQARVQLSDGKWTEGRFILDSGQIVSGLLITESFRKAHPTILADHAVIHPPPVSAVGGEMTYSVGRVRKIQIGSIPIEEPVASFPLGAAGIYARPEVAGAIGADILGRFDVVFDYSQSRLFLKRTNEDPMPYEFDMSGLQLGVKAPDYSRIEITGVMKGSPADRAKLQKGDVVLQLNGQNIESVNLADLQQNLRRPQGHCVLLVQRGTRKFSVTLKLKRLV